MIRVSFPALRAIYRCEPNSSRRCQVADRRPPRRRIRVPDALPAPPDAGIALRLAFYGTDPTRPATSFKTVWAAIKDDVGLTGRRHDNRHTFITDLAESGEASDETIRDMAGHV
jgi:hypothetical protein